jgi:hypothetical protein
MMGNVLPSTEKSWRLSFWSDMAGHNDWNTLNNYPEISRD